MSAPADDERFAYFVAFDFHGGPPRMLRAQVVKVTSTQVRFAKPVPLEQRDRITMEIAKVDYTPAAALARAYARAEVGAVEARKLADQLDDRVTKLGAISAPEQLAVEDIR